MKPGDLMECDQGIGRVFEWVDIDASIRTSIRYIDVQGNIHIDSRPDGRWKHVMTVGIAKDES